MNVAKCSLILIALILVGGVGSTCYAGDHAGSTDEPALPDRNRNLLESRDDYYDAVQRLQDADAALVRARESAMKDLQSAPEYAAAVKAVDQTYEAFTSKKNPLIADLEKKDPRFGGMRSQAAAAEAKIDTAWQNPATTQDQLEQLCKDRDTFLHEWKGQESDAIERAQLVPLRQAWIDASSQLEKLQEKQRMDVESTPKLKTALADVEEARKSVEDARTAINGANMPADIAGTEELQPDDFLRRYNRAGFAGNDAWWTYGWTTISNGKATAAVPSAGK